MPAKLITEIFSSPKTIKAGKITLGIMLVFCMLLVRPFGCEYLKTTDGVCHVGPWGLWAASGTLIGKNAIIPALAATSGTGASAPKTVKKPPETEAKTYVYISAAGGGKKFFSFFRFPAKRGETIFSLTVRAASKANIAIEYRGYGPTAYVAGIGGLREFDNGPASGWLYRVNGKYPGIGCGLYKIKGGERIEWVYKQSGF